MVKTLFSQFIHSLILFRHINEIRTKAHLSQEISSLILLILSVCSCKEILSPHEVNQKNSYMWIYVNLHLNESSLIQPVDHFSFI